MLTKVLVIFLCFLSLSFRAPAQQPKLMSRQTSDYFMTASALFLYDEDDAYFAETWAMVKETLADIERAVSVSMPDSDVARFNVLPCGGEIEVSAITAEILTIAKDVYTLSNGLYDPTVYPLVDLWGFSPRFNQNTYTPVMPYDRLYLDGRLPLPDLDHIAALLPLVGLDGIVLREEKGAYFLQKNTPAVLIDGIAVQAQLDLGGVAKGYACDRVLELLRERGYTMGYFVCGGSSMALLSHPDGDYMLSLRKPRAEQGTASHYASIPASNTMLSTSSDASHSFLYDSVIYCHIIDPRTGFPINMPNEHGIQRGIASATLLCSSAAYGDALTTALCILGEQEAPAFLSRHALGRAVLAVYQSDLDTFDVLTNAPDDLVIADPAYRLFFSSPQ